MSRNTYFDTGILLKCYVRESNSPEALTLIDAEGDPQLFSHMHEIEIPNAIRLKRFRGEITKTEEEGAIQLFRNDIKVGRLERPAYNLVNVFRRTEMFSARHSGEMATRSLDLLHLAAALEFGCTAFASFDERQRTSVTLAGLKIIPAQLTRDSTVTHRKGKP